MSRTAGPMIGRLVRHDREREASGVAWLDGHGVDRVRVKIIRVGVPGSGAAFHRLILGLPLEAVDGETATDRVDVVLVARGRTLLTRHVPILSRSPLSHPMWTRRPIRGEQGMLRLGVFPVDDDRLQLGWQRSGDPWHHIGDLLLPPGSPEHELWGASEPA